MLIFGGKFPNRYGEGVCNDEGYICYFLTEIIKFYWLMLLYLGELYRLLGASSCSMFILVKKLSNFIDMLLYPGELQAPESLYLLYVYISEEVIKFYLHVIIPRWAIQAPGSL
jgi:hypothetical protein